MDLFLLHVDDRLCYPQGFIILISFSWFWLFYTIASLALGFSLLQPTYTVSFIELPDLDRSSHHPLLFYFINLHPIENELHGGRNFCFFHWVFSTQKCSWMIVDIRCWIKSEPSGALFYISWEFLISSSHLPKLFWIFFVCLV